MSTDITTEESKPSETNTSPGAGTRLKRSRSKGNSSERQMKRLSHHALSRKSLVNPKESRGEKKRHRRHLDEPYYVSSRELENTHYVYQVCTETTVFYAFIAFCLVSVRLLARVCSMTLHYCISLPKHCGYHNFVCTQIRFCTRFTC